MTNRPPPQPLPANSRLYNQQAYSGFVMTIDGHLTYSPFTDVIPASPNVDVDNFANWTVGEQFYFYDTSRPPYILDRTGAFIKIYSQSTEEQIATAIIVDANLSPTTMRIKVIKYEFGKSRSDLTPTFNALKLRLEDNWKFCSNIPSWIPAGAESLSRWIPIMSSELEPSLGQKLNLKGGVTSVDGLSVPLVLDTSYQDNNRLQRLFAEDAATYQYDNNALGQLGVDNVTETDVSADQVIIRIASLGFPVTSLPDFAGEYTNYPYLNPSGTELALPEPWFIDTEAIIATTRVSGIVPPGATPQFQYGVQRGIDSTPKTQHGKYTVLFNGMAFPIGQTIKLWEVSKFNQVEYQDWIISFRGMIENLAFDQGLAACTVEISSITFTARVNAGFATQNTTLERRATPTRSPKHALFHNTFIAEQPAFQDTFCWVKVGGVALPLLRVETIDYQAAIGSTVLQALYFQNYGLTTAEINQRAIRGLNSGTTSVGYKIGLTIAYVRIFVNQLYRSSRFRYQAFETTPINNWFLPEASVPDGQTAFLPLNSPWGFYILEQLPDSSMHSNFIALREDDNLRQETVDPFVDDMSKARKRALCDYLSEEPASFIHMFQNFSKGYSRSALESYATNFWYTGDDSSITNTDFNNAYLQTSIIDVILQILTSTGSGTADVDIPTNNYKQFGGVNGAWDLIPREFGLGITLEEIDLESFNKVRRKRGGMNSLLVANIYMESGEDNPQKFLEEQILKPFFFALGTDAVGKIILVDVADIAVGLDVVDIDPEDFVRKNGQRTRVSLTYDATDLSDSFTYNWKEPYRSDWDDPYFVRSLTSSGTSAGAQTRTTGDGNTYTIKSKARLFQRIQASPINYDLKYAPVTAAEFSYLYTDNIGLQALRYLRRFGRIVPRAKFELFYDYNTSPDIGDVVTFNLDAIPNKEGIIGDAGKTIVGKIIDIKADRKAKTAEYTAILTDTSFAPADIVWNLTAELNGPGIVPLTWELTIDDFCIGTNETIDPATGDPIWAFDSSQFLIGSTIIVWDLNWRYITDTTITDVDDIIPGVVEIEVADDTGFITGYRITLETLANSTSLFAGTQTWLGEGQRYLF